MKDIDKLQKRSRKLRDLTERAGSTGLAITGLIGLLFIRVELGGDRLDQGRELVGGALIALLRA